MLKPILVLCLGNEVLSDDAFGFKVASSLSDYKQNDDLVEIIFAPLAGFNLINLLQDRHFVLVVDAIVTGRQPPGTLHFFSEGQMTPSIGLTGSHQINLPTAMALGIQLGINMPSNIDVIAAEAADVVTLDENLTPALQAAISPAKSQIIEWIEQKIVEIGANGRRKQNSRA